LLYSEQHFRIIQLTDEVVTTIVALTYFFELVKRMLCALLHALSPLFQHSSIITAAQRCFALQQLRVGMAFTDEFTGRLVAGYAAQRNS
jgi:hypothetical protein